jgi:hypothetical protein
MRNNDELEFDYTLMEKIESIDNHLTKPSFKKKKYCVSIF